MTCVSVIISHFCSQAYFHVLAGKEVEGGFAQFLRVVPHQMVGCLEQQDADFIQVHVRIILRQHVADQLGQCAGGFHAGRSAADDHEGQQSAAFLGVRFAAGFLEHPQ